MPGLGLAIVRAITNELNAAALALYERHGFSTSSKSGSGRDVFLGRPID